MAGKKGEKENGNSCEVWEGGGTKIIKKCKDLLEERAS